MMRSHATRIESILRRVRGLAIRPVFVDRGSASARSSKLAAPAPDGLHDHRTQALERPAPLLQDGRERRIELADSLGELLTILNSRRSVDEILDHVLERVINLLDSAAGAIYLLDDDSGEPFLRVKAARGMDLDVVATRLRVGVPITGLAVHALAPGRRIRSDRALPTNSTT